MLAVSTDLSALAGRLANAPGLISPEMSIRGGEDHRVREHHNNNQNCEEQRIVDHPRYGQSFRRERCCDEDGTEFRDQEKAGAGIPDAILPGMDRSLRGIHDESIGLDRVHGDRPFRHGQSAVA